MYQPVKNAIGYFGNAYSIIQDVVQRMGSSLMPSGLELAVVGVPESILGSTRVKVPDAYSNYSFAVYDVRGFGQQGNKVVVTRNDGRSISLDPGRAKDGAEEIYVRATLGNHGIHNKGVIGRIAKELRKLRQQH